MAAYSRHYGRLAGCCAPAAGYLEGLGQDDGGDPTSDPSILDTLPVEDAPAIVDPTVTDPTLWDIPGLTTSPINPVLISADPSLVDPSSPNYTGPIASSAGLTPAEIASLTAAGVKVASTAIAPTSAGAAPRVTVAMPVATPVPVGTPTTSTYTDASGNVWSYNPATATWQISSSPIIAGMSNTTLMLGLAAAGILLTVVMGSRK